MDTAQAGTAGAPAPPPRSSDKRRSGSRRGPKKSGPVTASGAERNGEDVGQPVARPSGNGKGSAHQAPTLLSRNMQQPQEQRRDVNGANGRGGTPKHRTPYTNGRRQLVQYDALSHAPSAHGIDKPDAQAQKKEREYQEAFALANNVQVFKKEFERKREQALAATQKDHDASVEQGDDLLGRQIRHLWTSTRPSARSQAARARVIDDVNQVLEMRWPGCRLSVQPFGSSLTGMLEATSDLDLCLADPTRPQGVGTPLHEALPLPPGASRDAMDSTVKSIMGIAGVPTYYDVRLISRALWRLGNGHFREVIPIVGASVPIVKFVHSATNLPCDVNVNDAFGVKNSHLIRAYIDIEPDIVSPFLFAIKKWASMRQINDPSGASGVVSLNSYTLILFGLQYLQGRGIVPNLQSKDLVDALAEPSSYVWQRPKNQRPPRRGGRKTEQPVVVDEAAEEGEVEEDAEEASYVGDGINSLEGVLYDRASGARRFETTFARLGTQERLFVAEQVSSRLVTEGIPFVAQAHGRKTQSEKIETLARLLSGFFEWWAAFDFEKCGISLRHGSPIRRIADPKPEDNHILAYPYIPALDQKWAQQSMLCQDPFVLDRNTCGAVLPKTRDLLAREAERAASLLKAESTSPTVIIDLFGTLAIEKLEERLDFHTRKWTVEDKASLLSKARDNAEGARARLLPVASSPGRRRRW